MSEYMLSETEKAIKKLCAIAALSLDESLHGEVEKVCKLIVRQEFEIQKLRDHIVKLKIIHPPKLRHNCVEWDEMEIDEYSQEFNVACLCYDIESS